MNNRHLFLTSDGLTKNMKTSFFNIRPLAKLSKAVKVADTGNQGKAESKALSAVTVTLREDTESFKKTDGVFNKDTFS